MEKLREMFERVEFLTSFAMLTTLEEITEGNSHIVEYVHEYHLVPVGSFALECIRKEEPVLDALLILQEGNNNKIKFYLIID